MVQHLLTFAAAESNYTTYIHTHTGISCRNFFHSTILPPWKVSWVSREADKLRIYNSFVWSYVLRPKWNSIEKTYSWIYIFNFAWKSATQTHKVPLTVDHTASFDTQGFSREEMIVEKKCFLDSFLDFWLPPAICSVIFKIKPIFLFIWF